MLSISSSGSFDKTAKYLNKMSKLDVSSILNHYGSEGVNALAAATPMDSGETAHSWDYEIQHKPGSYSAIYWKNSHIEGGKPIAVLIQYGHGTKNGGYVQGRDYINPALRPIFDRIANEVWKGVTTS